MTVVGTSETKVSPARGPDPTSRSSPMPRATADTSTIGPSSPTSAAT